MNEAFPFLLQQHPPSALSERGARIAETTHLQIQDILAIINHVGGLNRHAPDAEGINQENPVYNFDEHVRDSASATLLVANTRLQSILQDDRRWRPLVEDPQDKTNEPDQTFSQAVEKIQQQVFLEKNKSLISNLRNNRRMEQLSVRKATAELRILEERAIQTAQEAQG